MDLFTLNNIDSKAMMAGAMAAGFAFRFGAMAPLQRPILIKQVLPELLKVKPEILQPTVPLNWFYIFQIAQGSLAPSGVRMINLTRGVPTLMAQAVVGTSIAAVGINSFIKDKPKSDVNSNNNNNTNDDPNSEIWQRDLMQHVAKSLAITSTTFAATYPFELIRTRLSADVNTLGGEALVGMQQLNPNTPVTKLNNFFHQNARDAARWIYQREGGLKGFYRGAQPMFAAYMFSVLSWVLTVGAIVSLSQAQEVAELNDSKVSLTPSQWGLLALAGSSFVASIPLCVGLETISRRMMLSPLTGTAPYYSGSILQTFQAMNTLGPNNLSRVTPVLSGWVAAYLFTQYCRNDFFSAHKSSSKYSFKTQFEVVQEPAAPTI